ncbi:MAG: polysaccharide biosynthesis tyrosine autokinase [Alistipes sp.]|nr:polysaccharide biosynthesis tyrosine autokinase [Alistipes sp.]
MKQKENELKEQEEEEVNLRELLEHYLSHWKWFILSFIVVFALGAIYYLHAPHIYSVTASVLLRDEDQNRMDFSALDAMGMLQPKSNMPNEIAQFKSPDLMKEVIKSLELQTNYVARFGLRNVDLYTQSPVYVRFEETSTDSLPGAVPFVFVRKPNGGYQIQGTFWVDGEVVEKSYSINRLPNYLNTPYGKLYVAPTATSAEWTAEMPPIKVTIYPTEQMAQTYASGVSAVLGDKQGSLIELNANITNRQKGIDFMRKLIEVYNRMAVEDKNMTAMNTAAFIDERLKVLVGELDSVEQNVEKYKQINEVTDISSEAQLYLQKSGQTETKASDVETQLAVVRMVESYILRPGNESKAIPALNITDQSLQKMILDYNTMLLTKERLDRADAKGNPAYQKSVTDLNAMRANILQNVNNQLKSLTIALQDLSKQDTLNSARIQSIPRLEREFSEVKRQQELKASFYLFLLQKREETSLTLAATSNKAKTIVAPRASWGPVSPRRDWILLICLALALAIPIGIIYVVDLLHITIRSREEVDKLSRVPVLGIIPHSDSKESLVIHDKKDLPSREMFRTLRNNLSFILDTPDKKVIVVTSTSPAEGKSYAALNLALSYTLLGKKILLIGLDIRNPKLADYMDIETKSGITSYLVGKMTAEEIVHTVSSYPNLYIIQAGAVPPNPNELLLRPALDTLIETLRPQYDMIIIDSAPVGVVSDTFLINRFSDVTLYVVREKVTTTESLKYINKLKEEQRLNNLYLVLNDSDVKGKRYGYGYGYGYGKTENQKK